MKKIIQLMIISFLPSGLYAEETLNWENCVKEASLCHPDLLSQEKQLSQAKVEKDILNKGFYPTVQISSSFSASDGTYSNQDSSVSGGNTDQGLGGQNSGGRISYSAGIQGKQMVYDGSKTKLSVSLADITIRLEENKLRQISSDLRQQLKLSYIACLKAKDNISLTQKILERRKQNLELVRLRYEAGREHKGALLTAKANAAESQYDQHQSERDLELALLSLSRYLGRPRYSKIKINGTLKSPSTPSLNPDFEDLARKTPVWEQWLLAEESGRLGILSEKAEYFPAVYAELSAQKKGETENNTHQNSYAAMLSLSYTFFDSGTRKAKINKAMIKAEQIEQNKFSALLTLQYSLKENWSQFEAALEKNRVQIQYLEAMEERSQIAQAQYSAGLITFDNWSIIEDDLVKAQKSVLEAKSSTMIAETQWLYSRGVTLNEN